LLADDMLDGGKVFMCKTAMCDDYDTDHKALPHGQWRHGSGAPL
jgi:hypothetical protein